MVVFGYFSQLQPPLTKYSLFEAEWLRRFVEFLKPANKSLLVLLSIQSLNRTEVAKTDVSSTVGEHFFRHNRPTVSAFDGLSFQALPFFAATVS